MIRVNRPFDRWFDLSDPYDDLATPKPREEEKPLRPDAHREWTYKAPRSPERRRILPPPSSEPAQT